MELLPVTALGLEQMAESGVSDAAAHLASIRTSTFLTCAVVAEKVMAMILPISIELQRPSMILSDALMRAKGLIEELEELRRDADENFALLFSRAKELANEVGTDIAIPRRVGRQIHRLNAPAETAEQHFRRNFFIPFLDEITESMKVRFDGDRVQYGLQDLLPAHRRGREDLQLKRVMKAAELYQADLCVSLQVIESEVKTWLRVTAGSDDEDLSSLVGLAKEHILPSVATLLRLYGTLPVSVATAERCFSKMKLLCNSLRCTMTQKRLSSLALIAIHKDEVVDLDRIIDRYRQKSSANRRLLL